MKTLTTLPFMVALVAAMVTVLRPTGVVVFNRRGLGALDIGVWRARARQLWHEALPSLTWFGRLWRHRTALIASAALIAMLLADQEAAATGVFLAATAAAPSEPTMTEVKSLIESGNRVFEEFKRTNDQRLAQLQEKGVVDPLIQSKLEKLQTALDEAETKRDAFVRDFEARMNRLALVGTNPQTAEQRAERLLKFNFALKGHAVALGRQVPPDQSEEQAEAYFKAFDVFLRRGDRALSDAERKAMSVGSDPDGGFVVKPDVSGRIVTRMFDTSPMRQYASIQNVTTDSLEGLRDTGEADAGWVAETGGRPETNTPQLGVWKIPAHEWYAQPAATAKLVEDAAFDIEGWLARKVVDKSNRLSNTAFAVGDGVGKPRGFASYPTAATGDATRAWGTFEHVLTGTNGSFGTDPNAINKILDLMGTLQDAWLANAAFYMNRTTKWKARQLTDASSAGKYVFIPSFQANIPDTFFGYPLRVLNDMVIFSTTGALAIAFGDMQETYQIVDRLGITVLVDPYTNKPYIRYYTRGRVGGDAVDFNSMKFLKFSA